MEYYDGILFLTTNRVGTFDEAFLSRINVSIQYGDFTDKQRKEIWYAFIRKLERDMESRMRVPTGTKEYITDSREVVELKLNGREIRNGEG